MYEFFKSEVYYQLISSLHFLEEFYTNSYSNPFHITSVTIHIDPPKGLIMNKAFIEEINKIKLTTPEKDLNGFSEFVCEVRENVLSKISNIPPYKEAHEIYTERFEKDIENVYAYYKNLGLDPLPIFIVEEDGDGNILEIGYTHFEILKKWKNGMTIGSLWSIECSLNKLCQYFQVNRSFIGPALKYQAINLLKTTTSINIDLLVTELIAKGYLSQMHKRPFVNLISGKTYFEPIQWNGNLSELNKLIKTMYSFSNKNLDTVSIDWKSISKIFLVNREFPESDKLKGASNAKLGSAKDLFPFWGYLKS